MDGLHLNLLFMLIGLLVVIYDIITLPFYLIFQKPWIKWKRRQIVWARQTNKLDPFSPYKSITEAAKEAFPNVKTVHQLFQWSLKTYGSQKFLGTREIYDIEETLQKDGKTFRKFILGDYKWMSMSEADKIITNLAYGLRNLGLNPKDKLIFLAETRAEWLLTAQACFKTNIIVATLYTNLGNDGLIHGINETDSRCLLVSSDVIPTVKKIMPKIPNINHIIYMEGRKAPDLTGFPSRINFLTLSQVQSLGKNTDITLDSPTSQDIAVIMYTSGSTGAPKGVLITHKSFMTTVEGVINCADYFFKETNVYPAYLPSAHILETLTEHFCIFQGTPIAYSSVLTLMHGSTGLKAGCKSDLAILKPRSLVAVPLMMDRIRKSVNEVVNSKGAVSKMSFRLAMKYKRFWVSKGFGTPILNRLVFHNIRQVVGGNVKYLLTGSAPLSYDTQEFIQLCLGVKIIQAYGLTETTGCGTVTRLDDETPSKVGSPLSVSQIRLIGWSEGNYHPTDKPYPRGEIVIGSDGVTAGYYKNEKLTKESYKEENGVRWFYSGDIGEIHPDGCLKIIDRKKDLVKLKFGEYISLGKVESELLTSPLVDNVCVFGHGYIIFVVALVVPNNRELRRIAARFDKANLSFAEQCNDPEICKEAVKSIQQHAADSHLLKIEIPQKIKLCSEEWSPDVGLVTAAFKVRRKAIENYYKNDLNLMMGLEANGVANSN